MAFTFGRSAFKVGTQTFGGGTSANFRVQRDTGSVYTDGALNSGQGAGGSFNVGIAADVAERVRASEALAPGDLVGFDVKHPGSYRKTSLPYSHLVAGVISTRPGITLANDLAKALGGSVDQFFLVLMGRVPVRATAENGPIHPGDLLVSSSRPGYAMRCGDTQRCEGAIIGKALEALRGQDGLILVLVMSH